MAWNPLPRLGVRLLPTFLPAGATPWDTEISPSGRAQLLGIFRRLAAVLHLTAATAQSVGKLDRHAELGARLAIFRARIEAGETSPRLASSLADFGQEFKAFIVVELGFRRV